jgi:hypothetical protein
MTIHVLPGDSLAETFKNTGMEGDTIVCRECFVTGELTGDTLEEFWKTRENFVTSEYGGERSKYRETVAGELNRLLVVEPSEEINLWFEYELFCAVNMWFCIDLLKDSGAKLFRVQPKSISSEDVWDGFGQHSDRDLVECVKARIQLSKEDISIASRLWSAFRVRDSETMKELGQYRSPGFPLLNEVCSAAVEIEKRPRKVVEDLKAAGISELSTLFPEFRKRAGVYGFGDAQVESLMRHE